MHEMSLALEVARLTAEQVDRQHLRRVSAVGVEVGDRAGVVADALEFCLEAVLTEPPFEGARPVLERRGGDVLRLAWIEVDDGEEDGPESRGEGAEASSRAGGRPAETAGPGPGGCSPLGDAPLPSERGPPAGAGDGRRAGATEREGAR